MLSKKTCEEIWHCHREIDAGNNLLSDIRNTIEKTGLKNDPPRSLKDDFGGDIRLQLGVPNGDNSHRLFYLSPDLALPVVVAHIANKRARLVELNQIARMEIDDDGARWNEPSGTEEK